MKNSISKAVLVASTALQLVLPPAANASLIDTTTNWIGGGVSAFGEGATGIFGQTFTAPDSDTVLESFTFWLADFVYPFSPDFVDFAAYIMAWDHGTSYTDMHATDSILWQSEQRSTTDNHGLGSGWEEFSFNTGGLELQAGESYVVFLSSLAFNDGVLGSAKMGLVPNALDGDYFVAKQGGSFTDTGWTRFSDGEDAAIRIYFSAPPLSHVPEPNTALLILAAGLGMVGAMHSRKSAKRQTV